MRRTASEVLRSLQMRVARLEKQALYGREEDHDIVSLIKSILDTKSLVGRDVAKGSSLSLIQQLSEKSMVSAKTKKVLASALKVMTPTERHNAFYVQYNRHMRTRATTKMFDVLNKAIEDGDHATLLKTIKRPDYASALGDEATAYYTDIAQKIKKLRGMDRRVFNALREELQLQKDNVPYLGKVKIIKSELLWRVQFAIEKFDLQYLGARVYPSRYLRASVTDDALVVTLKVSDMIEGLLMVERRAQERGKDTKGAVRNENKIPAVLNMLAKDIEKRAPKFLKVVGDLGYDMKEGLSVERREIIQTYREDPSWGETEYDREFEEGELEAKWEVPFTHNVVDALYHLALGLD